MADSDNLRSLILSKLSSTSELSGIQGLFSSYLEPFLKIQTREATRRNDAVDLRGFLQTSIVAISSILDGTPKIEDRDASELFNCFKLCLRYMDALSLQPVGKPHYSKYALVLLIHCYVKWGRYEDADREGDSVLKYVHNLTIRKTQKGRIIPELPKKTEDKEIAFLVLNVVMEFVKSVANRESKEEKDYRRVLSMVEEVKPWWSVVIDDDKYNDLHGCLVTHMKSCSCFLVGRLNNFDVELTFEFCSRTFSEFNRPSLEVHKFAHELCISLFSQLGNEFLSISIRILKLVLDTMASKCKVGEIPVSADFLMLLYHVCDMLLVKGHMELHSDIYELIRLATGKNANLENCLAMLWQSKRLNHGLCTAPVSDAFISTFSTRCRSLTSLQFWRSCMKKLESLEANYEHCFSVVPCVSCEDNLVTGDAQDKINDIKKSALGLISNIASCSVSERIKLMFLSSSMLYDVAERMILKGSVREALSCAKESFRLRHELFCHNFIWTSEYCYKAVDDNGEIRQNDGYRIKSINVHPAAALKGWAHDKGPTDFDLFLTPYNVLSRYLESLLQLGTAHEIVGNGTEAEALLVHGKGIAVLQALPIFSVCFHIGLGKLYSKKHLWRLAEEELNCAQNILDDRSGLAFCLKCRSILQAAVHQQHGDLSRIRSCYSRADDEKQSHITVAESYYELAGESLKHPDWENCISKPKDTVSKNEAFCDRFLSGGKDGKLEVEAVPPKVSRKAEKTLQPEEKVTAGNDRSSKLKSENVQNTLKGTRESEVNSIDCCGCNGACVFDEISCWHCVSSRFTESSSLKSVIQWKWESNRRQLLNKVHNGLGYCMWEKGQTQNANDSFLESISMLVKRSTFNPLNPIISLTYLDQLIKKNVLGETYALEHASSLYNTCRCLLRCYSDNRRTGNRSHDTSSIPLVVSGLKLAFILCHEVPELCKKVSRLLAVLYAIASVNKDFCVSTSTSDLCESQWATFFLQASQGVFASSSTYLSSSRLAPESVAQLEDFIKDFFKGLPPVTIVCLSVLGDDFGRLLQDILSLDYNKHSWMMISRLKGDSVPVVVLLPIDPIVTGRFDVPISKEGTWDCPWGHSVVDDIAPLFGRIIKSNDMPGSPMEKLDHNLAFLLSCMEDNWFGICKYLLLGICLRFMDSNCYIGKPKDIEINRLLDDRRDDLYTEPMILVPDSDIHMLPWECMPALQRQEIYRMPTVLSILDAYKRGHRLKEKDEDGVSSLPMIDPLNAYYLLNPGGDLRVVERALSPWFSHFNIEGASGTTPGVEQLITALEQSDIFMYIGHGDADQYIPAERLQELKECAGVLLMGCSSGCLYLNGPYAPTLGLLSYLVAGSPVLIGNLWNVYDYDAFQFTVAFLTNIIQARSDIPSHCTKDCGVGCKHKPRVGSSLMNAREACSLRYMMGAAPVCYGIPTAIRRKDVV